MFRSTHRCACVPPWRMNDIGERAIRSAALGVLGHGWVSRALRRQWRRRRRCGACPRLCADGHAVAAHTRGAPSRQGAAVGGDGSAIPFEDRPGEVRLGSPAFMDRRWRDGNLLDGSSIVPVMARRSRDGIIGRRPDTILERGAGGGGAYGRRSAGALRKGCRHQLSRPRSQELVDMNCAGGGRSAVGNAVQHRRQDIAGR